MRKPKYQYYIAVGKLLKKALELIKHHKAKARAYERMLAEKSEECNYDKQHDDLRKYEYSGCTVKDFNDRCRKSFFDILDKEDEEDDKDI